MRDPARINRIIELLRHAWHAAPDQRLGQLVDNLLVCEGQQQPAWTVEDDVAERRILAFKTGGFDAAMSTK